MVLMGIVDTLGVGDVLNISIMGYTDYSDRVIVQADGTVYTQLAGSVPAAGLSISEFKDTLSARFAPFYKDPVVLVAVENTAEPVVLVSGRVASSGPVPYLKGMTLSQAITGAGGTTPDANLSRVILRSKRGGKWVSRNVNLQGILEGQEDDPTLFPGDIVVVPKSFSLCTAQNLNVLMTGLSLVMTGVSLYLLISGTSK